MSCKTLCQPLRETINGHNISPFIKATLAGTNGLTITVGNNSFPSDNNTAMIKSLEFGSSDGLSLTLVIVDEKGGSLSLFLDKIPKKLSDFKAGLQLEVEWGWVETNCDGSYRVRSIVNGPGNTVKSHVQQLEVSMEGGKIKYTLRASDAIQAIYNAKVDTPYGTEDHPIPLKDAIDRLCRETPPFIKVEYKRTDSNQPWKFKGYPERGPSDAFRGNNQNKLAVIRNWIAPYRTENDKGVIAFWDYQKGDTIVLMEDPSESCNERKDCQKTVGTFIVNGGKCSNVINFTPKINWTVAYALFSRGGGLGPGTGEALKHDKGCVDDQDEETGIQQTINVTLNAFNTYGPKEALRQTKKSQQAHSKAEMVFTGAITPIEAELSIQGVTDPDLLNPAFIKDKFVSIIVVNPFHLLSGMDGECGEWLAMPTFNEVLTNKFWKVEGVNHQISEGSYVTTLKVKLFAPGIHYNLNNPLGGPGSEGYFIKNNG